MTHAAAVVVVWLNWAANALGSVLLAPLAVLPGWLSATGVAVLSGLFLLWVFKYTSNQRAIARVRNEIKANLLALKLFKESPAVTLRAQARLFRGALLLLLHALVPMAVMALPVCLLLGQLALWYQARPLRVGESALVTLRLGGQPSADLPEVVLEPDEAAEASIGPVRVPSQRAVYWSLLAKRPGRHRLRFRVGQEEAEKELVVGEGFQRVSLERPRWNWSEILLHPWEAPFRPESPVQSIAIAYPQRPSWTSGADAWLVYWFVVSMLAAFVARPWMNVSI